MGNDQLSIPKKNLVLLSDKKIWEIQEGNTYEMECIKPTGCIAGANIYHVLVKHRISGSGKYLVLIGYVSELEGRYLCHVRCETAPLKRESSGLDYFYQ